MGKLVGMSETTFDVVIVGGGPAGLSAALMLGRGCRKVLVCDGGPGRNERAEGIHGFVTRDGTPPAEFRRIGREQLAPYDVTVRDTQVTALTGELDGFSLTLSTGEQVRARRVLLAVGMVDRMLDIPGYARLWGHSIFTCPYCHGWELKNRPWGLIVPAPAMLDHARFLLNWNPDLTVFTLGRFPVSAEDRARLGAIRIEERPIEALHGEAHIEAAELSGGERVALGALFVAPMQTQSALVTSLGLDLDDLGYVKVNAMGETSRRGVHAAGDLTTMMQSVLGAASAAQMAAVAINHLLVMGPDAHWGPPRR